MYLRDMKEMPAAKTAMKKLIMKRTNAVDEHDDEIWWDQLRRARVHLDGVAMLLFRAFYHSLNHDLTWLMLYIDASPPVAGD